MAGKSNNRRNQMTKKMIREAFFKLLQEKELSKISVTEIAHLADINRGTFYKYYKDPYDLLDHLESELIEELMKNVQTDNSNLESWLEELLTVLQNNRDMSNFVIVSNGSRNIIGPLLERIRPDSFVKFTKYFNTTSPAELELYLAYFVSGSIGMIDKWLNEFPAISPKKMTHLLVNTFATSIYD